MKIAIEERIDSPLWLEQEIGSAADLAALLKAYAETPAPSKKDVYLFSGSIFKDEDTKLQANITEVHAIILDFDGCTVPWETVSNQLNDWEHVVYSSWSNGIKSPGARFRVVIPFANSITENAVNVYHHLWDFVTLGLLEPEYGLDQPKRSAQSWFYLPSKTDHNIWFHHQAPTFDPMAVLHSDESIALAEFRNELQAEADAKARHIEQVYPKSTTLSEKEVERRAAKALEKFANPNDGNNAFYRFGHSLKGHGIDMAIIERLLRENAHHFGTQTKDRLADIPRIMKSVGKT